MSSTTTTDAPTRNVANQKKRRPRWEYTDTNVFLRTQFPGHRPRYLPISSIDDSSELFQACADLWPEYFSASARYAFSPTCDPQTTKGLIGIAFYHPRNRDLVEIRHHALWDLYELREVAREIVESEVHKMAGYHRISVSGPFFVDLQLVREGRETLRVAGNASAGPTDLCSRVVGLKEKREQESERESGNKRRREVEAEAEVEEDEKPRQRRRLRGGDA